MKATFEEKATCVACHLIGDHLGQVECMYQSHVEVEDHGSRVGFGVLEVETLNLVADADRNHGSLLYRLCPGHGFPVRPSPVA